MDGIRVVHDNCFNDWKVTESYGSEPLELGVVWKQRNGLWGAESYSHGVETDLASRTEAVDFIAGRQWGDG